MKYVFFMVSILIFLFTSVTASARHHSSRDYSFPATRTATGNTVFIYDPTKLTWGAYDSNGRLVRTGPGSGGSDYCHDLGRRCHSPTGTFRVWSKEGSGYRSTRYPLPHGGAPMPYAMFFSKYYAVHGSYEMRDYNASHGCVRVRPSDAEWLNHNFINIGSTVIIRPY